MSYVSIGSSSSGSKPGGRARGIFGEYIQRSAPIGGLFEDILEAGEDAVRGGVNEGRERLEGGAGEIAEQIIRSSQFKVVLDAVEGKAQSGVKKVVGQNAIGLIGLGIGAGALGGVVLQGKLGVAGAGALTVASLLWLMAVNSSDPVEQPPKRR